MTPPEQPEHDQEMANISASGLSTHDYLRAHIERLLHTTSLPVSMDLSKLTGQLVDLFRNTMSCEHRVAPCSGFHMEGERILICRTELDELQRDRQAIRQQKVWCEHWEWMGRSWRCRLPCTTAGQALFCQEGVAYCVWCGAKKPQ